MVREDPGRRLLRQKREFHEMARRGLATITDGDAPFLRFDGHASKDRALGANKSNHRLENKLHIRPPPPAAQSPEFNALFRKINKANAAHGDAAAANEVATPSSAAQPKRRPQSAPSSRGGGSSVGHFGGKDNGSPETNQAAWWPGALQVDALHSSEATGGPHGATGSPPSSQTPHDAPQQAFSEGPAWSLKNYADQGYFASALTKDKRTSAEGQPSQPKKSGVPNTATQQLYTLKGPLQLRTNNRASDDEGSGDDAGGDQKPATPQYRRHSFVQQKRNAMEALRQRELEVKLEARNAKRNALAMRRTGLLTAVFLQGAAAALAAQRLRQVLRVNRRRHEAALVLQRAARAMLLRHRFHLLRTANHQMVEDHHKDLAVDLIKELINSCRLKNKFARAMIRVNNASALITVLCHSWYKCRKERIRTLTKLFRLLEPHAVAKFKLEHAQAERNALLPQSEVTPQWLVKKASDLHHYRNRVLAATNYGHDLMRESKRVDALQRQHQLNSAAEAAAAAAAARRKKSGGAADEPQKLSNSSKNSSSNQHDNRKNGRRKRSASGGKSRSAAKGASNEKPANSAAEVAPAPPASRGPATNSRSSEPVPHGVRLNFSERDRVSDSAVVAACKQHIKLERFRIFRRHRAQEEQARHQVEAARHEATRGVKSVELMDEATMVAFLGDSKYCVEAEFKRVAQQRQEDLRNTSARAAKDLLQVPMEDLRVFSGPPRARFEETVLSVVELALKPRMELEPWKD